MILLGTTLYLYLSFEAALRDYIELCGYIGSIIRTPTLVEKARALNIGCMIQKLLSVCQKFVVMSKQEKFEAI
jgi:hypothetical protein